MGAFDFESAQDDLLGIKGETKLEFLFNSVPFLKTYAKSIPISTSYSGSILNRPVFYYTKLREEIYFINTKVVSPNGFMYYTFAVNDKSFFRRFSITTESRVLNESSGYSIEYIINMIIKRQAAKVQLNIYKFEREELDKCDEYINGGENKYLLNGSYIEFLSVVHYNKRLWLYLFCNQEILNVQNSSTVRTDLGDPNFDRGSSDTEETPSEISLLSEDDDKNIAIIPQKSKEVLADMYNSDDGGHYDITSEKRKKYEFFVL